MLERIDILKLATAVVLVGIMLGTINLRQETLQNRERGIHTRAVSCAALKGAVRGLEGIGSQDAFVDEVYRTECAGEDIRNLYKAQP